MENPRALPSVACAVRRVPVTRFLHAAACALILAPAFPVGTQPPRRDGSWEIRVDVEIDGDATLIPSRTLTECVTKDDAADVKKALPYGNGAMPSHCSASDHKIEGNKVSWSFKCESPQPMTGDGHIIYVDESHYAGTINFARDGKKMALKYAGKRLGDCTK